MKIEVIYKDNARFELIRRTASEMNPEVDISGLAHAGEPLHTVLNGTIPDLLIVDEATRTGLSAIESLNLALPKMDILLISSDTSSEFLLDAMRSGVREVVNSSASQEALQTALNRIMHKRGMQSTGSEGRVLAFLSCKGGSGATFLASNLAYVLAREFDKRVALIDLNLQFGDAALFVSDSHPPSNIAILSEQIHRLDASLLAASMLQAAPNLFVLAAPDDPEQSLEIRREHVEAILRVARQNYDFVIFDLPRTLDNLSVQVLDIADAIFQRRS